MRIIVARLRACWFIYWQVRQFLWDLVAGSLESAKFPIMLMKIKSGEKSWLKFISDGEVGVAKKLTNCCGKLCIKTVNVSQ